MTGLIYNYHYHHQPIIVQCWKHVIKLFLLHTIWIDPVIFGCFNKIYILYGLHLFIRRELHNTEEPVSTLHKRKNSYMLCSSTTYSSQLVIVI